MCYYLLKHNKEQIADSGTR